MMKPSDRPIGVFDSGLGGLTVLKEIMALLPNEDTVYFGDSGRTPYGSKSPDTIIRYSRQITRFLQACQVKLIVIACNTASSRAFQAVSEMAGVPVIEVITPGAQAAAQMTSNGRVGVIGTKGTVDSGVYVQAIHQWSGTTAEIVQQACPLFVGLAEEGWWDLPVSRQIADIYLEPLRERGVDTLVLACTHYPLLRSVIQAAVGPEVSLIDAGSRVAEHVRETLAREHLLKASGHPGEHRYFTSDSIEPFRELGGRFLGQELDNVKRIAIEQYQE